MRRLLGILLAVWMAGMLSGCATPRLQAQPNQERIHQDHDEAQQDLRREEDKRQDAQDE